MFISGGGAWNQNFGKLIERFSIAVVDAYILNVELILVKAL